MTFPDGSTTNIVKYCYLCKPGDMAYVGDTPLVSKTANISDDGTMETYNTSTEDYIDTVTIPGVSKLKVDLTYGYDYDGALAVFSGDNPETAEQYTEFFSEEWEEDNEKTTFESIVIDGDTVSFLSMRYSNSITNHYGYYAKVYPIYNTEQSNTILTTLPSDDCAFQSISGNYMETEEWNNG